MIIFILVLVAALLIWLAYGIGCTKVSEEDICKYNRCPDLIPFSEFNKYSLNYCANVNSSMILRSEAKMKEGLAYNKGYSNGRAMERGKMKSEDPLLGSRYEERVLRELKAISKDVEFLLDCSS